MTYCSIFRKHSKCVPYDVVHVRNENVSGEEKNGENKKTLDRSTGLHFVKLRPEPMTGDNIRNLVQVLKGCRFSCVLSRE